VIGGDEVVGHLSVLGSTVAGLVLLSACAGAKDVEKGAQGTPVSNVASNATQAPPTTAAKTSTPATPAANRSVTITAFGYGVSTSGSSVGYAFTIKNENAAEAAESVQLQIAFQDDGGTVLKTSSETIAVLGPAEQISVGGTSFFSQANDKMKMTVQALPSKWTAVTPLAVFTFANTNYVAERFSSSVTGVIKSPFTKDYKLVRVSAIGLDEAGKIIGAGFTYVDFVPAGGQSAVSVSYTGAKPATVVLHGQLTSLSLLSP
jgi:hypothetical protein